MSNRIQIVDGHTGWRLASPLLEAIWPEEVVATLPWKDVTWAHADHRVLHTNGRDEVIGHAELFLRNAIFEGQPVKIGGIGGVATRADCRRQGVATAVMQQAAAALTSTFDVDFALLFCEPRHAPLYQQLGWHFFAGEVFVEQPRQGSVRFTVTAAFVFDHKIAPRAGMLDLCGLPW